MKKREPKFKYYYVIIAIFFLLIAYSIYYYYKSGASYGIQTQEGTVVHWHPELYIKICGEDVELVRESTGLAKNKEDLEFRTQIHTHKKAHELHLGEYGPVDNPETYFTLKKAMLALDINFNENCIMNKCNGDLCGGKNGNLKVYSGGQEIKNFVNHGLKDKERIDIIFE